MGESREIKQKIAALLKALAVSLLLTTAVLFLMAFLLLRFDISQGKVTAGVIAAYALSGFFGGLIAGKCVGHKKYLWGLFAGTVYFVLLAAVSALAVPEAFGGVKFLLTSFLICSCSGTLGGMIS